MRFIRGKRWVQIPRRANYLLRFFFVPLSYSWGILLLIRNSINRQELHQLPRVTWFLAHLHHGPLINHLQTECQRVSYPNDLLILSKLCQNSHGQVTSFWNSQNGSFSPAPTWTRDSQEYPSSHIWNLLLHYDAWNPNGAFAHHELVKCLGRKSSLQLSAVFYPLECCESSNYLHAPVTPIVKASGHQLVMDTCR